jgi:hypothetical protein
VFTLYFMHQPSPSLVMLHVADFQYLIFLISFLQFVTDVTSVVMFYCCTCHNVLPLCVLFACYILTYLLFAYYILTYLPHFKHMHLYTTCTFV